MQIRINAVHFKLNIGTKMLHFCPQQVHDFDKIAIRTAHNRLVVTQCCLL